MRTTDDDRQPKTTTTTAYMTEDRRPMADDEDEGSGRGGEVLLGRTGRGVFLAVRNAIEVNRGETGRGCCAETQECLLLKTWFEWSCARSSAAPGTPRPRSPRARSASASVGKDVGVGRNIEKELMLERVGMEIGAGWCGCCGWVCNPQLLGIVISWTEAALPRGARAR